MGGLISEFRDKYGADGYGLDRAVPALGGYASAGRLGREFPTVTLRSGPRTLPRR